MSEKSTRKYKKHTFEEVKAHFEASGCELLTDLYQRTDQKLQYKCACGKISQTSYASVKNRKVRCISCKAKEVYEIRKKRENDNFTDMNSRKQVFIERFGYDAPILNLEVAAKKKETNLRKYGVEEASQHPEIKKLQQETLNNRYNRKKLYEKSQLTIQKRFGVPNLAYLSRPASKQSQKLFWEIYKQTPEDERLKVHFAELNGEFCANLGTNYYKFDYVDTKNKKAIEYNGKNFHPHPSQEETDVGWCAFHPNKTVKEAREYEKLKYESLETRGFKILTVWDYEYKNFEALVHKCLQFLQDI